MTRSNPISTGQIALILVGVAGIVGVVSMTRRKPAKTAKPKNGEPAPKPEQPKPDAEKVPPEEPKPDPDADLPDCKFDQLMLGQVYRDARGTFFFVRPDQERVTVGTSPVDIRLEYGWRQAAWSIVAVAGLYVGATVVIPTAFLGGALVGPLANIGLFTSILGTVSPSTVRLKRVGDEVISEVIGPAGVVGSSKVPTRRCKNSVR